MKINAIVSALVAIGLLAGGPSFGQGDGGPQQQRNAQRERAQQRQPQRADPQQRQRNAQQQRNLQQRQRDAQPQYQRGYEQQARRDERGAGPDHNFRRGDRLPQEYRSRSYVVDDWRGHNLTAPPRGYHWVQTGADYVLVAVATGIILQLLLNN